LVAPKAPRPHRALDLRRRRRRADADRGAPQTPPVGARVGAVVRGGDRRRKAGIIETNFREETETDLFGEQACCAAAASNWSRPASRRSVEPAMRRGWMHFECLHELKLDSRPDVEGGIAT